MKMTPRMLCCAALVVTGLVLCSLPGCGKPPLPDTVPVAGTVTYQGAPLEGATVTFRNTSIAALDAGGLAMGTTDAEGKFVVQSHFGPTDVAEGVVPGEYRVTVSKFIPPNGMSEEEYQQKLAEEEKIMEAEGAIPPDKETPPQVEMLPAKYSSSQESTLTATIADEGDTAMSFDLE